jgi:hypothetical protein
MAEDHVPQRSPVTAGEWAWVAAASLLIMALLSVPYLVGLRASTPEMAFGGFLFGLGDMHSYLAKMRYGAYDGWVFRITYTAEPHRGALVFPFHLALGKVAAVLTGEGARVPTAALAISYHAARVVAGLALLAVLYRFAAEYLDTPPKRRLAWALAVLAAGLDWIPAAAALAQGTPQGAAMPVSFYIPEAFSILLLYGLPHLALSRALLLGGWLALFRAVSRRSWGAAVFAGALWLGMGVIVPFYAALLGVLLAVWLGAQWLADRRFPRDALAKSAAAGAGPALVLVYNAWAFSTDPVFSAWAAQNDLPSPPVGQYALAYGLMLALAAVGMVEVVRGGLSARNLLLLVWPPVAAALAYAPINVQRRLLEGVIVPLGILAALGLWRLVGDRPKDSDRPADGTRPALGWRLRQVGAACLVMLLLPSVFLLVGGGALTAANPHWPVFHPAGERAALDWLRQEAAFGAIVLATHEASNVIPAYAGVRTYVGLGPETIDEAAKVPRARAFFHGGISDGERLALLSEIDADYVWAGPQEANPACTAQCFDPATLPLRVVYASDHYTIYAVEK